MITVEQIRAIQILHPEVVSTVDDVAYDVDGNEVSYDLTAVDAKVVERQAEFAAAQQSQADARQSALNKLMALGLTEEEALALGVK